MSVLASNDFVSSLTYSSSHFTEQLCFLDTFSEFWFSVFVCICKRFVNWPATMTVAEELEVGGQGLKQTFKDLFSGACGGIAQVLLGMYDQMAVYLSYFVVVALGFAWTFCFCRWTTMFDVCDSSHQIVLCSVYSLLDVDPILRQLVIR